MASFDVKEVGIDALFPDKDEDIYKQQGINKMCALVRTALCDEHIHHLQFNCQDKKVLLDAQIHPEKYPTLMVRVAGFTQYWCEIGKPIQDEVIYRTEYETA